MYERNGRTVLPSPRSEGLSTRWQTHCTPAIAASQLMLVLPWKSYLEREGPGYFVFWPRRSITSSPLDSGPQFGSRALLRAHLGQPPLCFRRQLQVPAPNRPSAGRKSQPGSVLRDLMYSYSTGRQLRISANKPVTWATETHRPFRVADYLMVA